MIMTRTAGVLSQLLVLLLVCRLTLQRQEEMAAAAVVDDSSRQSKAIWSSNRFQVIFNNLITTCYVLYRVRYTQILSSPTN